MEYREVKTIIYDDNGYKETITETIPVIPTPSMEDIIKIKENQLLEMYEELQKLKETNTPL
jgi:hypothetical protein